MKPKNACGILYSLLIIFLIACSPQKDPVYTGIKIYKEFDSTRTFDTTQSKSSLNYYRPVKIDLYFPSSITPVNGPLTYGDILDLYEERMNFSISADSCKKMSLMIAGSIADYLEVDDPAKILSFKTSVYNTLPLPVKKHPLIIYAAGMNGSSWENPLLFDSLAKEGYIIAAISSVGKFPGYMTTAEDLDEQVRDIMFVKRKMKALPFIDGNKIGLLSWSMGGSAATKAAMLSNDFKCLLSFDGTEIHYYGNDSTWDREFDELKEIPPFIPERISIPYMYLSSGRTQPKDSVYVFPQYILSTEKYYLQIKDAVHESFSSIISVVKAVHPQLKKPGTQYQDLINSLTVHFFNQFLKLDKTISTREEIISLAKKNPELFSTDYPARQ